MGQRSSLPPTSYFRPSEELRLHQLAHGEAASVSLDGFVATRTDGFNGAVVFSNRPVAVGETVNVRVSAVDPEWSGTLKIGFTSHDPDVLRRNSAIPEDIPWVVGNSFWMGNVAQGATVARSLFTFHLSANGDVALSVNGRHVGRFIAGVDVSRPLWAVFDVYGVCRSIRLEPRLSKVNSEASMERSRSSAALKNNERMNESTPLLS
jgi:hypothetical protein